jgi:hypothetical protein
MQSSQGNLAKETSYSSGPLGQSPGANWSPSGRALSSSRQRRPPSHTGSQRHPAKNWSIPGTLIISANFLFDCSGPARPCNSHNNFILARTLFLPGGEVFNEAEPCNIQAKNPPQKSTSKKDRIDGLRHSTNTKSPRGAALATLACDTPREKSPKGAAGLAQQVRKIEVFFKRLSEQKSPKGVAGLAQQVRKIEVFFKRLSEQKSPKGAAGLAQQVRKIEVFFKRLPVQKSPKGAAGLAQQARKIEVYLKRLSAQKSPKGAARLIQHARRTDIINVLDQVCNAFMNIAGCAKVHSLIIQPIVTYVQRGHHTLHRFNLQNNPHLPIVK